MLDTTICCCWIRLFAVVGYDYLLLLDTTICCCWIRRITDVVGPDRFGTCVNTFRDLRLHVSGLLINYFRIDKMIVWLCLIHKSLMQYFYYVKRDCWQNFVINNTTSLTVLHCFQRQNKSVFNMNYLNSHCWLTYFKRIHKYDKYSTVPKVKIIFKMSLLFHMNLHNNEVTSYPILIIFSPINSKILNSFIVYLDTIV